MSREDLDAVLNLIAAVNAGVVQAIARRGYERIEESCLIRFIISDTGIGIDPKKQKTIFERFQQGVL